MLGLLVLFLLAVTVALFGVWVYFSCKLFVWLGGRGGFCSHLVFRGFITLFLVALPLHNALIYPLIENECQSRGQAIVYKKLKNTPDMVLFDRAPSDVIDMYATTKLLESTAIKSIYSTATTYGIDQDIRNRAGMKGDKDRMLALSDQGDINCGPFYKFLGSEVGNQYLEQVRIPTSKCLAMANPKLSIDYLKVTALEEQQFSWRQMFHPIHWRIVRYEKIANGAAELLAEIKEFDHPGFGYPVLLEFFHLGSYSCKSQRKAIEVLFDILGVSDSTSEDIQMPWSRDFAHTKYLELRNKAMGFPLPEGVFIHEVHVTSGGNNISTSSRPYQITLNVHDHNQPVLVRLAGGHGADFVVWNISTKSETQAVYTKFSWQNGIHTVLAGTKLYRLFNAHKDMTNAEEFYVRDFAFTTEYPTTSQNQSRKVVRIFGNKGVVELTRQDAAETTIEFH